MSTGTIVAICFLIGIAWGIYEKRRKVAVEQFEAKRFQHLEYSEAVCVRMDNGDGTVTRCRTGEDLVKAIREAKRRGLNRVTFWIEK